MRAKASVAACGLALALAASSVGDARAQAAGAAPAAAAPKAKPSKADQAKAGKLFRDGERAYAKHDYEAAAAAFEEAYATAPHPDALLNAIDARERAGELRTAARLCDRLAADYPDDAEVKSAVRGRLAGLSPKLGRIDLSLVGETRDLTLDGEAIEPGQIWVDPGDHVLRATVDGEAIERKVNVVAGAREALRMEPPPAEPVRSPEPVAQAAPPPTSPGGLHPAFFFVGAGTAAVLGGVTVWSGVDTNAARDDFDANPTQAGLDDGLGKQTRTNVLLGVTGGVAVLSAVVGVFFTDWGGGGASGADAARLRVDVGAGGATISGRF